MSPQTIQIVIWSAIAILAAIIEAATVSIVSCWFIIGAVFAVGANLLGCNLITQFIVFIVVSGVSLAVARPIIRKHNKTKIQPTNADMNIGAHAIVTETIDNIHEIGTVRLKGLEWTARSKDGSVIEKGTEIVIDSIDGVKLIVTKL